MGRNLAKTFYLSVKMDKIRLTGNFTAEYKNHQQEIEKYYKLLSALKRKRKKKRAKKEREEENR